MVSRFGESSGDVGRHGSELLPAEKVAEALGDLAAGGNYSTAVLRETSPAKLAELVDAVVNALPTQEPPRQRAGSVEYMPSSGIGYIAFVPTEVQKLTISPPSPAIPQP